MENSTILIDIPAKYPNSIKKEVCELVVEGGQIKPDDAKVGIHRAELLAVYQIAGNVIAVACLKNPRQSYRERVFKSAQVPGLEENYLYELGYIVTRSGFEGKGLCQKLLVELYPKINHLPMFATTRKPEMAHILRKLEFEKCGEIYKENLSLFTYK